MHGFQKQECCFFTEEMLRLSMTAPAITSNALNIEATLNTKFLFSLVYKHISVHNLAKLQRHPSSSMLLFQNSIHTVSLFSQ